MNVRKLNELCLSIGLDVLTSIFIGIVNVLINPLAINNIIALHAVIIAVIIPYYHVCIGF